MNPSKPGKKKNLWKKKDFQDFAKYFG